LVLNCEKCHFMVKQVTVLGHVISERHWSGQGLGRDGWATPTSDGC
jgi:hypothetical protein